MKKYIIIVLLAGLLLFIISAFAILIQDNLPDEIARFTVLSSCVVAVMLFILLLQEYHNYKDLIAHNEELMNWIVDHKQQELDNKEK